MSNWERLHVAGVTHEGRQSIIRKYCQAGDSAELRREPNNAFDCNAVAVFVRSRQIGYIPADFAKTIASNLDSEMVTVNAEVYKVSSFEGDDGREIWMVTLDIHWREANSRDKSPNRKVRTRKSTSAVAVQEIHEWLDQETSSPADQPLPAVAPTDRLRRNEIIGAIAQGCRKAASFSMRLLRVAALKVDGVLKRIAGDDRTFLWILRFLFGFLVVGATVAWLLLSL